MLFRPPRAAIANTPPQLRILHPRHAAGNLPADISTPVLRTAAQGFAAAHELLGASSAATARSIQTLPQRSTDT